MSGYPISHIQGVGSHPLAGHRSRLSTHPSYSPPTPWNTHHPLKYSNPGHTHSPPPDKMTDICENVTFPLLLLRVVITPKRIAASPRSANESWTNRRITRSTLPLNCVLYILFFIHNSNSARTTRTSIVQSKKKKKHNAQYFLLQVAQHTSKDDKWLVIENEVYDITQWASRHPGGSKVISHYAGQDATVSRSSLDHRSSLCRGQDATVVISWLSSSLGQGHLLIKAQDITVSHLLVKVISLQSTECHS